MYVQQAVCVILSLTFINFYLSIISAEQRKSLLLEKESIQELKVELSDYSEDVKEMNEIVKAKQADLKLSKGARRYGFQIIIINTEL